MKRGLILLALIFILPIVNAAACDLDVTLVSQDPNPALPGEYVELVFQLTGIENSNCGGARFEFIETFPFSLEQNIDPIRTIDGSFNLADYQDFWNFGYRVSISENALNEDYELEVHYAPGKWDVDTFITEKFNVSIEDVSVDFEIYINDYNSQTKELTFEILNIGESDIEALTIEIPKQNSIDIKGANRKVVGDLDSNEYTTASFEAILMEEVDINLTIFYTDSINTRRSVEKTVHFDPSYFNGLARDQKSQPIFAYIIGVVLIAWIIWSRVKKHKRKKAREKRFKK